MEILLGLQGFTGDVVVEKKGTFEIVADFVNVSEKELLNRLVSLGWYYNYLSEHVEKYELNSLLVNENKGNFQFYRSAFFSALSELLSEYCEALSDVEYQILGTGGAKNIGVLGELFFGQSACTRSARPNSTSP